MCFKHFVHDNTFVAAQHRIVCATYSGCCVGAIPVLTDVVPLVDSSSSSTMEVPQLLLEHENTASSSESDNCWSVAAAVAVRPPRNANMSAFSQAVSTMHLPISLEHVLCTHACTATAPCATVVGESVGANDVEFSGL